MDETNYNQQQEEQEQEIVQEENTEIQNNDDVVSDPEENTSESVENVQETTESTDYQNLYSEQLELTNHLISGQIFFMGLIFGVLLFKIFWDRWKV